MSSRAQRRQYSKTARRQPRRVVPKAYLVGIIVTAVLLLVVVGATVALRSTVPLSAVESPAYANLPMGSSAPHFRVTTLDGTRIDSDEIASPLMLEVFATWCPHCQRETGIIEQVRKRIGGRVAIVAVTGSDVGSDHQSPESAEDVLAFARQFGVHYPVAFDGSLAVARQYLQGGFPTIVFINRAKRIVAIETGDVDLDRLTHDARLADVEPR
jgi:thiol-disulfide isomerase/thioredoxin